MERLPSNVRQPPVFELPPVLFTAPLETAPLRWPITGAALFMRGADCPKGCADRACDIGRWAKLVLAFTRGIDCVFTRASDMRRASADAVNGSLPCTVPARCKSLFEARTKLFELIARPRLKSFAAMLVTPLRPLTDRALRKLLATDTLTMLVPVNPRPYHGR